MFSTRIYRSEGGITSPRHGAESRSNIHWVYSVVSTNSKRYHCICTRARFGSEEGRRDRGRKKDRRTSRERERKRKEVVRGDARRVKRAEMGARLSMFCPVARTSKRNPVRGTKPRIAVDKLSFDERRVCAFARADRLSRVDDRVKIDFSRGHHSLVASAFGKAIVGSRSRCSARCHSDSYDR